MHERVPYSTYPYTVLFTEFRQRNLLRNPQLAGDMPRPVHLTLVAAGILIGVFLSRVAFATASEPSSAAARSSVTKKRSEHLILKHHAVGRDDHGPTHRCRTWSCSGEHENDFEIVVTNEYVIDELMADAKNVFNVQLEKTHVEPAGRDLSGRRYDLMGAPMEPWKTQATYFVRSGLRLWLDLSWLPAARSWHRDRAPAFAQLPTGVNNLPAVMDAVSAIGFDLVTSTSEVLQIDGTTYCGVTTYIFRR